MGSIILLGAGKGMELGSHTLMNLAFRSATRDSGMASWCGLVALLPPKVAKKPEI